MGVREQSVKIGVTTSVVLRNVYDIQVNSALNFETGYVQYDNIDVPVWRPTNPNDDPRGSRFREGLWRNLYYQKMLKKEQTSSLVECSRKELKVYGQTFQLPEISSGLTYQFLQHIKKFQK